MSSAVMSFMIDGPIGVKVAKGPHAPYIDTASEQGEVQLEIATATLKEMEGFMGLLKVAWGHGK